jgi:hypothetical protein
MQTKKTLLIVFAISALSLSSCEDGEEMKPKQNFKVTIENVFEAKDYFASGTTEGIGPGGSYSFSFHAGKGHYLSFATMFVQSNDLFYAPAMDGIALYDGSGDPVTGDITSMVNLWDAGTEVNEEPGTGPNQAPRQAGPDTGTDENGNVALIADAMDGFTYPADEDIIMVSLTHDGGTEFTAIINNVSDVGAFQTPLAPGAWVIHSMDQTPLFMSGSSASSGLEKLAEDGNNADLASDLDSKSGYISPFAPGAFAITPGDNPLFMDGQDASSELEALAEDGNPAGFTNAFNTPKGGSAPAPIFPGESYEFSFDASDGDMLSFATMLVQTNDLFIGAEGISLYANGQALSGDITSTLSLWDAYTEVNEFPGAGNNQAPRQSGPNTGMDETGNVQIVNDAFSYPGVAQMLKVTITPM